MIDLLLIDTDCLQAEYQGVVTWRVKYHIMSFLIT